MKKNELVYQLVKEEILHDISELEPGTKLLSRVKMMKKYDVARSTIEKSIAELVGEGYLYAKDGSGTYVAHKKDLKMTASNIKSWGVILPDIVNDTYPEFLRGVGDIAHKFNHNMIVCNTDNDVSKQDNYIHKLIKQNVSGVIVIPAISKENQYDAFSLLCEKNIPFVFCIRSVFGFNVPKITCNDFYGSYKITNYLICEGHSRIAFVSGKYYSSVEERYHGYLTALYEHNLKSDNLVLFGKDNCNSFENGYYATSELLKRTDIPDAIVCFNDSVAAGAYKAIFEKGLVVGKDISITGYDDSKLCYSLPVSLTTVKFPKYETGTSAANILLHCLTEQSFSPDYTVLLQPEIIIRDSTKKRFRCDT